MSRKHATTWQQLIPAYDRAMAAAGLRPATRELRGRQLRHASRHMPELHRITQEHYDAYLADNEHWGPNYRRSNVVTLRDFFRWLVENDLMLDPRLRAPKVRCPAGTARPASETAVELLWSHPELRMRAAGVLAAGMGLRRAEIAAARVEDISDDLLLVRGKGGKNAPVPVHEMLWAVLPESGPIVPSQRDGGHLTPTHIGRLLRAGMNGDHSSHQLRHRFATVTYARTGMLRELQECLRHGSLSTTEKYVAVNWQGMRRIVDAA